MLLIDAMESRLSSVETWPTAILIIIFAFDPHMSFALSQLENIRAFFFGNNILLQIACPFFSACSGHPLAHVEKQFGYLCELCSQLDSRSRLSDCQYYYNKQEERYK